MLLPVKLHHHPVDARLIQEMVEDAFEADPVQHDGVSTGRHRSSITHMSTISGGINLLDSTDFDVVLLDLDLPDSRGIATLETLRARWSSIPVIVLTGLGDYDIGVQALQSGAEEFLSKMISPRILSAGQCIMQSSVRMWARTTNGIEITHMC